MKAASAPVHGREDSADRMSHERIKAITVEIKNADRAVRSRFPFLKHQDAIGCAFFAACIAGCVASSLAYIEGLLPFWFCIVVNAICLSIVREIEHDLVHNLYFRTRPALQNLMMLAVWPFLGNLPHPWFRREVHLLHHRTSGQHEDLEERLIGNGMKFGPLKILAMVDAAIAMHFRRRELEEIPAYDSAKTARACFPVVYIYYAILFSFLLYHGLGLTAATAGVELMIPDAISNVITVIDTMMVIYVLPNMLRQTSVQILSSAMHYHGDVDNRLRETQVLNAWWMFPLQLFSWNFGSTHTIHHFFVSQPFYLRQMVASAAHAAFRKCGIRYNDTASVLRANRYAS